jgi:hypothetical protein
MTPEQRRQQKVWAYYKSWGINLPRPNFANSEPSMTIWQHIKQFFTRG